ncbi:STAS domain-containing protein [Streptomyces sp. NPDC021056]|uniref:STAS domain-containing protein n=1 Tax=Streptomyces sp. NPDC021056 TaxID=3155012 RepID=UPI0033D50844
MTPLPRYPRLLPAAVWLLVCALATTAIFYVTPVWARTLCLIAAAAALRTAIRAVRRTARSAVDRIPPPRPSVVRLQGEITAATADRTARLLADALAARPTALEIDMSEVALLTRDGAMAFLPAHRLAHEEGVGVTVRNASPQARTAMSKLGLDQIQHYYDR